MRGARRSKQDRTVGCLSVRVGLSLLTLIPGISGGGETYARELARALARVGTHEYVALVPPLAPDAGDGLPTVVADEYPSSTTTPGRLRAMGTATLRPARFRSLLADADVVHYPLTVRCRGRRGHT